MLKLNIKGKEYKVRFGYNSFCDSDLMDRTEQVIEMLGGDSEFQNEPVATFSKQIKPMFEVTRALLFEGFKKYNPVDTIEEVGDLLDDYLDESTENEHHGLFVIFAAITQELFDEGFFGDVMKVTMETIKNLQNTKSKKK